VSSARFDENGNNVVQAIALDDFVVQYNCSQIDFIKMDVEDAEVRVIMGAEKTIKRFLPKLSIAVYHSHENAQKIKELILDYVPEYKIVFGGCCVRKKPFRPYMLYAYIDGNIRNIGK
jgi:hypothetical protein